MPGTQYTPAALPNPALDRVAYGEPTSPERWNLASEQTEQNLEALRRGRMIVVDNVEALQTRPATPTGGVSRFALVIAEMAVYAYVEGDADIAVSELEFFGSLRRVAAPAGAWYRVAGVDHVAHLTEAAPKPVGAASTADLFVTPIYVQADGARPVTVTLHVDEVTGDFGLAEITLYAGTVAKASRLVRTASVSTLWVINDLPAGQHALNIRVAAEGAVVFARRTITARVG